MSEEYQQGYEQGIKEFAERLKKYYGNLQSTTVTVLVAYHVEQIKKELLKQEQN